VKELQNELDDLSQRLDEAGGATQAQVNESHTHLFIHKIYTLFIRRMWTSSYKHLLWMNRDPY